MGQGLHYSLHQQGDFSMLLELPHCGESMLEPLVSLPKEFQNLLSLDERQ
jgi:hypothetical protein